MPGGQVAGSRPRTADAPLNPPVSSRPPSTKTLPVAPCPKVFQGSVHQRKAKARCGLRPQEAAFGRSVY